MKKLFFTLFVFGTFVTAHANNNDTKSTAKSEIRSTVAINGSITDINSNETLAGVEVSIEGTSFKTYTDFDGNFTFGNLKSGKYNIIASFISYEKNVVKNIEANTKSNQKVNIEMSNSK